MTEDEKIELVIKEYRGYLDNSNYDICHSIKGVWFFYLYDNVHNIYECFYKFITADELTQIITGEIINNVNMAVECTAEEIVSANSKKCSSVNVDVTPDKYDLQDVVKEFMINIKAINHTMNLIENACKGVEALNKKKFNVINSGNAKDKSN